MLKKILKLKGAQELTKNEQKSIKGGIACRADGSCQGIGTYCCYAGSEEGICRQAGQSCFF
jgi:hypothetical protein